MLPQVTNPEDYRPWYAQTEPWLPVMHQICQEHSLDPEALTRIPEGSAIVFSCGEVMIKLLPPFWRHELELDLLGLTKAQGKLPVRTPEVLGQGQIEDWGYFLTRKIPGTALKHLRRELSESEYRAVAFAQGELLASLHQLDPAGLAGHWSEFVSTQSQHFAETQRRHGLAEETLSLFSEAFSKALPSLPATPQEVFLHCDLTDEHALLEQINGQWRLTGLLDFGDMMRGCSLYDLAAPALMLPPHRADLRRELISGFGQDVSAEQLFSVQMLHRFTHLPGLLRQHQLSPTPEAFKKCYCER